MNRQFLTICMLSVCMSLPQMARAGDGILLETDVCSMGYFYYPDQYRDECGPGLKCYGLVVGDSSDLSGVCCSEYYNPEELGTNCVGCHDWQYEGSDATYKSRVTGKVLCNGGIRYETEYRCASWYYGTNKNCKACPSNASCPDGSTTFSCNKDYYANGSACTKCPDGGTTTSTGATSVSQCCLASGASFSDATGKGNYTDKCCAS